MTVSKLGKIQNFKMDVSADISVLTEEELEEERIISLLKKDEQTQNDNDHDFQKFQGLESSVKLEKLQDLVKRSQVFSSIIADTLFESSIKAAKITESSQPKEPEESEPKRKKMKGQVKITDLLRSKKKITTSTINSEIKDHHSDPNQFKFKQPDLVSGVSMKGYQLAGMEWLVTLYQNGLNGILADEMGLGKTLQCIALIAFLIEQGIHGPFLICCPLSTVSNWINEFKRFAPSISVLGYVGTKSKRSYLKRKVCQFSVIITSYELSINDFSYLKTKSWKFLIVDEGHRLKNANCLLIRKLKQLKTSNRLLITGTPLQNNLNELWSLLNFILPEIFHDIDMFQRWFDFTNLEKLKSEEGEDDEAFNSLVNIEIQKALVNSLHTILRPFLLRRLKKDVLLNLPPKREYIIYGKLTSKQELFYKSILSKNFFPLLLRQSFTEYLSVNRLANPRLISNTKYMDSYVDSKLNSDDPIIDVKLDEHFKFVYREAKNKKLQNVMMQLRLVCNSPYLFFYPWNDETALTAGIIENSSKLKILSQILPKLLFDNHKVLIFSQFTSMLDLIQDYLREFLELESYRLDGSIKEADRAAQIKAFNEGGKSSADIFLLSTRSGGLGINLTASDTVILFDSDWNPQVDLQAMDRIHRIGQTKPCLVFRLIMANTIEEFLLAKADSKRKLERLIIQSGDFKNLLNFGTRAGKNDTNLLNSLTEFLNGQKLKTKQIEDNVLSEQELDEILTRTPKSYEKRPHDNVDSRFSHISLFETVTSMT